MPWFPAAQKAFTGLMPARDIARGFDLLTRQPQRCRMIGRGERRTYSDGRRTLMADKGNDPVAIWQAMISEMEKGFNSFANQAMASPEFSKAANQVSGATVSAQKQFGELMEKYLVSMNLPSRAQIVGMAERLQAIENELNQIKATLHQMQRASGDADSSSAGAPRPPRTKRPSSADGEQK
jgi:hypothetical protein